MKPTVFVTYKGTSYPLFDLEFSFEGEVMRAIISVESLSNALLKDDEYVDDEAQAIDENIFFFIPDEIAGQSEEYIVDFVQRNAGTHIDIIEHITKIAESEGWGVSISETSRPNIREVCFSKYTDMGQDFSFEVELVGDNYDVFTDSVYRYYEDFDPDEETMLWVGPDGHGKNGAPYRLKDVLKDMEQAKDMICDLYDALNEDPWTE